jgi:hypothetical protein
MAIARELLDRQWPAHWIVAPDAPARDAGVYHFRRTLTLDAAPQRFVVHVSADNRYLLHVNGRRVGTGPARGDLENWPFDTYDLASFLQPGANLVAATVWNYGVDAPMAQMSRRTGFMLQGDDASARVLDTNREWQAQVAHGHAANPSSISPIRARRFYYAAAPGERRDGAVYDWQWDRAHSDPGRWRPAREIWRAHPRSIREGPGWMMSPEGWLLVPNSLPAMLYEPISPGNVARQTGATIDAGFPSRGQARIPAQTEARILLDRRELTNGYPEIVVSGGRGARVRMTYAEALYDATGAKGNRNEIEGKEILGIFDELVADGGDRRRFEPLWFRTWRFLEIAVTTGDQPITIDSLGAHFTGYPFVTRAHFASNDQSLNRIFDTGWLTARLAAHETYMDAPYWEQLQYLGDTRIDALITLAMTGDDRLPRRALELFDQSRSPEGLTQSRYPTAEPQYIPPYSLFFVDMLHDHWMYVGDRAFLTARLPATRSVLDWFLARRRADGLLDRLPYWVHGDTGTALDDVVQDADGGSGIVSIQLLGALRRAAELEDVAGDRARAASYRAAAADLANACAALWDREHGLMADTPRRRSWSHPVNIVALLEGVVPPASRELVTRQVLAIARHPAGRSASGGRGAAWPIEEIPSASYYFRFYLARALEAAGTTDVADAYLDLLGPWRTMLGNGLTTWAEHPEPTRSDCHAWSAHPTLDLLRIVAGIRPGAGGFSTVILSPALGSLTRVSASHPHPRGDIVVSYERAGAGTLTATVSLPVGVTGELRWGGQRRPLKAGQQRVELAESKTPSKD